MITESQESAFKKLIQSTGRETTPDKVLSSVLQQLHDEALESHLRPSAIIPKWAWVLSIGFCLSFLGYFFYGNPAFDFQLLADWIPSFSGSKFNLTHVPELPLVNINPIIPIALSIAVIVQMLYIKNFYEKTV